MNLAVILNHSVILKGQEFGLCFLLYLFIYILLWAIDSILPFQEFLPFQNAIFHEQIIKLEQEKKFVLKNPQLN